MAQDCSRSAFDVRQPKHWSSLQAQQGRLLSDDDWNEAEAIDLEDMRRTRADVIGPSGSPDDGFKVSSPSITANGIDFTLAPGTMYAGGLRATLEQPPEAFSLQKDWLQQPATERKVPGGADRIDFVYLEVWQQPVTAVEDDELREVALGGPDTSVRLRTMRRVRLFPNLATENCSLAWDELAKGLGGVSADNEGSNDATLTVDYLPNTGPAPNLCSPSSLAGYLGAENQAIRVEIGSGGNTLLWGYDNASPLYRVLVTNDALGAQVIHFLTTPKDEVHWPLAQQIVELLPWSAVLPNGQKVAETSGGFLTRVSASYDPNTQNIKVAPQVPAGFGTDWQGRADKASLSPLGESYYYLRVWNRDSDVATPPEIQFTVGLPLALTGTGISVTLGGTSFRQGDFWIIAARPESPAKVVPWQLESGRLAEGIRRFYAPLGVIHWRPVTGNHTVFDCRKTFDPLTQPRGCCVTISPRPGWEHSIDEVADWEDLCLCFKSGDFKTKRTLVLRNKRVQVHGAGAASRIYGAGLETVLKFNGCTNVEIRDLSIRATAQIQDNKEAPKPHLAGALTLADCDNVTISNLIARCASGPIKSSCCISAYRTRPLELVRASTVRIQGCDLIVGANQVGLSVINYGRTTISDNSLWVDTVENAALPEEWLKNKAYRRVFRRTLIWHHGMGAAPAGRAQLSLSGTPVWIDTAPGLMKAWAAVVGLRKFKPGRNVTMSARKFLYELAGDLVYAKGAIGMRPFPPFVNYIASMLALRTAVSKVRTIASQGIVVAGTVAQEVRIAGNTVRDSVQGIHVGASAQRTRSPGAGAPVSDTAGRVVIANNAVYLTLMPESVIERHGIFVGNSTSLVIEDNHVECERLGAAERLTIDGIRVYGFLGRMAYITRNDLSGVTTGIRVAALNNRADGASSMWRVTENIAHAAAQPVDLSLRFGTSSHVAVTGNMS